MSIHPNLFRNGRDPKKEAQRLAELYTGYSYYPNRGGSPYNNRIAGLNKVSNRVSILKTLKITSETKQLPKEDREFWKEVIAELKKIPEKEEENLSKRKPERVNKPRKSLKKILSPFRWFLFPLAVSSIILIPRVIDGLTSVETLTIRIHERSKWGFNGSLCNDGYISHSQGRGTCSWHGGVNYSFQAGEYAKGIDECRKEANQLSWIH